MLRRKMYQTLLEWKETKDRECLLIKGARQVGKTYIVRAFAQEYQSFIEINFLKFPSQKSIFEGDLSGEEIFKRMTAYLPGIHLVPGQTLIFLDEIQKCAHARTALKFLAEDNRFDIIASGSLLGLTYGDDADPDVKEVDSIPVGYERHVRMYSLDFEEYLWACGYGEDTISYLKSFYDSELPVPQAIHEKYESLLREYMVIGGMPEVVAEFMQEKDFGKAQKTQEKILDSYVDDISRHAKGLEKHKVRICYDSIPRQLARENKKFKYSEVEKKATARKFWSSIQWLCDADMVHKCTNVREPVLPLRYAEKEEEFKLYLNDTGLLLALYGLETKLALLRGDLKGNAKGGVFENMVAEALVKKGRGLRYYRPDSDTELEFLIERDGGVSPIEVKAGNTATKSLNGFIEKERPKTAFKLIEGNVGRNGAKLNLPHYMIMFL